METLQNLLYGFSVALSPMNLLFCFLGCLIGTTGGRSPGVGTGRRHLSPSSHDIPAGHHRAIIMLAGIYYGRCTGVYNIDPREYSWRKLLGDDVHRRISMAKQGRAGPALGIAAFGSLIAGTLSAIGLMIFAPFSPKPP